MILFQAQCWSRSPVDPTVIEETELEMALVQDAASTGYDRVSIAVSGSRQGEQEYPLKQLLAKQTAETDEFLVEIDFDRAPASFQESGLLGLRPDGESAHLAAVRIVVRPTDRDGAHSSEHPCFALYLDWHIKANISADAKFAEGSATGAATAELLLTTGFSSIHPYRIARKIGARALQLRVDLDFLAATTGWFPLSLIDIGLGLPFDMPGLRAWFARLAGIDLGIALPDWPIDLRLPAVLPLGLRFQRSYLILTKGAGGHIIEARAQGLVLEWKWKGDAPFDYTYPDAEFSLIYAGGQYTFKAVLFAAQVPRATEDDNGKRLDISLPFGALSLHARAGWITAGLFAGGDPLKVCPELVVEMAEVEVRSSFANEPLWQSKAVRLHLRGRSLLACEVAGGKLLFDGLDPTTNWLGQYRNDNDPRVPALSGAAAEPDLDANQQAPAFTFVDGDFDPDGFLYLLWKQDNARLFERLIDIVPGLSRSSGPTRGDAYYVALEIARFDGAAGRDHQARLEWRKVPFTARRMPGISRSAVRRHSARKIVSAIVPEVMSVMG